MINRARDLEKLAKKKGFELIKNKKGSHKAYLHPSGSYIEISFHPGELPKGTERSILKTINNANNKKKRSNNIDKER